MLSSFSSFSSVGHRKFCCHQFRFVNVFSVIFSHTCERFSYSNKSQEEKEKWVPLNVWIPPLCEAHYSADANDISRTWSTRFFFTLLPTTLLESVRQSLSYFWERNTSGKTLGFSPKVRLCLELKNSRPNWLIKVHKTASFLMSTTFITSAFLTNSTSGAKTNSILGDKRKVLENILTLKGSSCCWEQNRRLHTSFEPDLQTCKAQLQS